MATGPSGNPGDKGGVSNVPSGNPGTPGHPPVDVGAPTPPTDARHVPPDPPTPQPKP